MQHGMASLDLASIESQACTYLQISNHLSMEIDDRCEPASNAWC